LTAPAYVPTLAELEAIERSGRNGRSTRASSADPADVQLLNWQEQTFVRQADPESFAYYDIVTPAGAAAQAHATPLRRVREGNGNIQADEGLINQVNQSLGNHQGTDTQKAHDARQAGIVAITEETRARDVGATTLESRLTEEQRRAYYETRGMVIQAYQGELNRNAPPSPTPSGRAISSTASSGASPTANTEADVRSESGSPARSELYDDRPIEGRLPATGNFNIYTDPARYDEEIRTLRELETQ
jgi:hypothetical protein